VIRLADLGQVVVDPGPLIGDGVVDDGPGLLLVVQKYRGANTVEVTRGVEEAMQEMQPGLPGITVDTTIFRPATFIEMSLDNLRTAMLLGIALVALIIIAFLFEWRTAFISLIAIPLSLVAAGFGLGRRRGHCQRHGAGRVGGRHWGGGGRRHH
jgi:multidrug efflux pump subunit AcrB